MAVRIWRVCWFIRECSPWLCMNRNNNWRLKWKVAHPSLLNNLNIHKFFKYFVSFVTCLISWSTIKISIILQHLFEFKIVCIISNFYQFVNTEFTLVELWLFLLQTRWDSKLIGLFVFDLKYILIVVLFLIMII